MITAIKTFTFFILAERRSARAERGFDKRKEKKGNFLLTGAGAKTGRNSLRYWFIAG